LADNPKDFAVKWHFSNSVIVLIGSGTLTPIDPGTQSLGKNILLCDRRGKLTLKLSFLTKSKIRIGF
jgi:hypothetical protein